MNYSLIIKKTIQGILLPAMAFVALLAAQCDAVMAENPNKGWKDYYKNYFPIGVAVSMATLHGADSALIVKEFNSVTPENDMKMVPIHTSEKYKS